MTRFARRQFDGLEVASLDCAGRAFAPHFHDEFVLGVNIRGAERIRLDGKGFEAAERDITLYNPAQIQSSSALGREWRFLSLYVDPALLRDAFDLSPDTVFERSVLTHEGAASRMVAALRFALDPDATIEEGTERLIQTLDELLSHAGSRCARGGRGVPASVRRVAERLCDEVPPPTLQALADEAGLSRVQLVRAFTRAYGLPPFAWTSNHKVNEARLRLGKGDAPARIAADLGFADQAHLTRRFRATYGVPPGRWRAG